MKTYGGVDIQINVFLTLALVSGEWSASWPSPFTPGEGASIWVDARIDIDEVEWRTILTLRGLELRLLLPSVS
jgi:hypothetical protein